jgi:hypothetical protein
MTRDQIASILNSIGLYSPEAVNLLLGTMAQESALGKYRKQFGGGPALGIYQMEPATHDDIWQNFLKYKPDLAKKILSVSHVLRPNALLLENNDVYSTCMCRVHYLRVKEQIPATKEQQALYWKAYYNTWKGKGTTKDYLRNYAKYVEKDK